MTASENRVRVSAAVSFQDKVCVTELVTARLAIRGIRSFDDKRVSIIEFFTVIVSHNGS
jgi:hypothetical protein